LVALTVALIAAVPVALGSFGGAAGAAAPVSVPVADTFARSHHPNVNYGQADTLQQDGSSRDTMVSYLSFAAPSAAVTKATLRLFSRASGRTPTKVFTTSSDWNESTLNWANRPALGPQVGSTDQLSTGQWAEADVTDAVQAGSTSFALTTSSRATRYFDSREAANPPQLVLEYGDPGSTTATSTVAPSSTAAPTSTAPTPPATGGVTKLLTVVIENHSLAQMQAGMPYLAGLATRFAYATNYTAIRHPSLPNYLAIAGGDTFGVTDDGPPASNPVTGDSVFDQAIGNGLTAGVYAESMTSNCQQTDSGDYAVKHNPWPYFSDSTQRQNCLGFDEPAGTPSAGPLHDDVASGQLPNAGFLIPDLCDDAHDCSLGTADNYLESWLPQIMAGPDYTSGDLAIVITADEDDRISGNVVLTAVLHPSLDGDHKVVSTPLTHYSLTRLYDQVLGTPLLNNAASAPDMAAAFGLAY
jgi:acid phosphatase